MPRSPSAGDPFDRNTTLAPLATSHYLAPFDRAARHRGREGLGRGTVTAQEAKRRIPKPGCRAANATQSANGEASANGQVKPAIAIDTAAVDVTNERLAATIPRLSRLEKATHDALERASAKDPGSYEVALLRRQHLESVRCLYDCQAKLIKTTRPWRNWPGISAMILEATKGASEAK